ncbi:MAG: chemotaxis protein CheW, partial [Evtepia sp.]
MQKSNPKIEGVFKPRDVVLSVVDLAAYLGLSKSDQADRDILIISKFNDENFAFHVHTVIGIDQIPWDQMKKPDKIIYGGQDGIATGIAEYEGRLITILDFEKIVAEISAEAGTQRYEPDAPYMRSRSELPILIVEDSLLLTKMILESLHRAGYVNTVQTENGREAWDFLNTVKDAGDPVRTQVACIVSDIEMPQMDGHHLAKLVKSDPILKEIPFILLSSMISQEMRIKGNQLGVDEQISKPEIATLVPMIDRLTEGS